MDAPSVVLLAAYASLALELAVLAVPSEASAGRLLAASHGRRRTVDVVRYALPSALCVALLLIPLAAVVWPSVVDWLGPLSAPWWLPWLGVVLVGAGRAVTLLGAWQLRRTGSDLQPGGVFAFTRNPILVGMYAFYLGASCIRPCLVLFLGFLAYALAMHGRVLIEEGVLAERVGADYLEYKKRVPRYLLFR